MGGASKHNRSEKKEDEKSLIIGSHGGVGIVEVVGTRRRSSRSSVVSSSEGDRISFGSLEEDKSFKRS